MSRTHARCAYVTGILLALTIEANATDSVGAGCRSEAERENGLLRVAQALPSDSREIFHGVGIITAIEPAGSLTINHEAIQGLMPAMEMMFVVSPRTLSDGLRPGDEIEFSVEGKTYTILDLKVRGHTQ